MNRLHLLKTLTVGTALTLGLLPVHALDNRSIPADTTPGAVLQVAVDLPVSWHGSIRYDGVAEVFGDYVRNTFKRMGYVGKVDYVDSTDERPANATRLNLHVIRWEGNHAGNIECTFTADLETPAAEVSLGMFSDMALHSIMGRGRLFLGDSFEDAAEGAIRDLYATLAKKELIAGISQARS